MKYLIILFSLITFSIFGQSGIEPTSLQGTPYQGGILVGVTPIIDEFTGDTIYLYQHSDTSFVKIDSLVYTDSLRLYTSKGVFTTYINTISSDTSKVDGSGVATRVAFWTGTKTLGSNGNLYWDDSNNRLGYKTSSPSYDVHLKSNSTMMSETANGWIFGSGGVLEMKGTNPGDSRLKWVLNGSPQTRADLTIFPTSITLNHPSSIYNDFDFRFTNRLGDVVFNFKSADKRLGINTDTPDRELDVNGEVRIRDLTTTTPTKIMANDNDGVLSSLGLGTGINISGGNIVNTSPDQTVSLTGAGITNVTGTYPNFTITSTEIGDIQNVTVSAPIVGGGVSGGVNIAIDTTSSTGVATQYDLTQIDQLQTISTSGTAGNITLSDGGGTLNLNVNDADSNPANEYNTSVTVVHEPGNARPRVKVTDNGSTLEGLIPFFETTSLNAGVVLGSNGASNSNFLRADGNWAIPTLSEVDGSVTNEGILGVSAGSGTTSVITSNTSTATGVTITAGTNMTISETTGTNGGNITLNASLTEVDGSITNEGFQGVTAGSATSSVIQGYNSSGNPTGTGTTINAVGSISISETTSTNGGQITLTGDYGAFSFGVVGNTSVIATDGTGLARIQAGTGITATNSGGTVTINSTAGATDLGVSGTGTIALTSSTGADVNIASGMGISLTSTGTTMTVSNAARYTMMAAQTLNQALTTSNTKLALSGQSSSNGDGVDLTFDNTNDEIDIITTGTYNIKYTCNCKSNTSGATVQFDLKENAAVTSLSTITTHYFNNTNEFCHNNAEYNWPFIAGDRFSLYAKVVSGTATIQDCNIKMSARRIK